MAAAAAAHNTLDTSQAATDVNQAVGEIVKAAAMSLQARGRSVEGNF